MRDAIAPAIFGQLRSSGHRVHCDGASLGIGEINPHISIALFAWKASRVNAVALKLGIAGDGGNHAALSGVGIKAPAMIGTFDGLPIVAPQRERKSPMWADVAESKGFSRGIASQHKRNFEARCSRQPPATDLIAPQDRVPKAPQEIVAALRRAGYCDWRGLLHHRVNPMITAVRYTVHTAWPTAVR